LWLWIWIDIFINIRYITYKSSNSYKKHLWKGRVKPEIQKGSSNRKTKQVPYYVTAVTVEDELHRSLDWCYLDRDPSNEPMMFSFVCLVSATALYSVSLYTLQWKKFPNAVTNISSVSIHSYLSVVTVFPDVAFLSLLELIIATTTSHLYTNGQWLPLQLFHLCNPSPWPPFFLIPD
jgi:hypothetical protein